MASVSRYHSSLSKRSLDLIFAFSGLLSLLPVSIILKILYFLTSPGPLFFIQNRVGKNGKVFNLIKFRTMVPDAEKQRGTKSLESRNIADGPVFKIPNDPRYTRIGKFLAKSGIDELPQVINVIKGEMSFVGPRPFPVYEANKLTTKQKVRERILPGITSMWVVKGAHNLSFSKWMRLDVSYVRDANLFTDLSIIIGTLRIISSIGWRKIAEKF